jgi:hypothetical protein
VISIPPSRHSIPRSTGCSPPDRALTPCRGYEEIKRFSRGLDETFEELRLDPQEFVDAGDHVVTRLRYYGRGKGSRVEIEEELYYQVTSFGPGRMSRIRYFTDWSEALAAARSE